MAVWMNRAGSHGEWETQFLQDGRIYLQWREIQNDLSAVNDKMQLRSLLEATYPDAPVGRISSYLGQFWIFLKLMQPGDIVGLPSKLKRVIHFGEITGPYSYNGQREPDLRHSRTVTWRSCDIPRSHIPQDILYKFGACTICGVDAEQRVRTLVGGGVLKPDVTAASEVSTSEGSEIFQSKIDIEASARDDIAKFIGTRFTGHDLAWLVEKVLRSQGFSTLRSPPGPDHGVDILAAPGPLGFGQPRIVVQVKSGASPTDRPTIDQLIGTMQNVHADQGLFVSWGGFKASVDKEKFRQFFRVRLWDDQELIDQILDNYDRLDDELRSELPLKRIWVRATDDDDAATP